MIARIAVTAAAAALAACFVTPAAFAQADFDKRGASLDLGEVELRLGGRLHFDVLSAPNELGGGDAGLRRLRAELSVRLPKDIRLRADYDFTPGSEGWRNLWVGYDGIKGVGVRAGQFIVPFNLEEMMESNDLLFMERALPAALAPSFRLGLAARGSPGAWSLAGGVFFNPIDDPSPRDDGVSIVGRAVYRPIDDDDHILHLGGALEHRELQAGAGTSFSASQEATLNARPRLGTGTMDDAKSTTAAAAEIIYLDGPLLLQAQGIGRRVARAETRDPFLWGGFLQGAYLFGDGERDYSRGGGVIGNVNPGKFPGAFEVGVRLSHLDLEKEGLTGGRETNVGIAMSWYPLYNLRLSANLIRAALSPDRSGDDNSYTLLQSRIQLKF